MPPPTQQTNTSAAKAAEKSMNPFQVLLLGGMVAAGGLLAVQGVIQAMPVAKASTSYHEAAGEADEALQAAQDALLQGQLESTSTDETFVSVRPLGGTARALRAETRRESGLVAVVETAGSFLPAPRQDPVTPDDMPRLLPQAANTVVSSKTLPVLRIRHDTRLNGETLHGLVVVAPDAELQLRDVVLQGAIVSEAALSEGHLPAFDEQRAPRVRVEGTLRLDDDPLLPGVSLVMPDGVFETGADGANLQIAGDIVAHDVRLHGRGSLFGQLASLRPAECSPGIERVYAGRAPRPWASALDMRGSHAAEYLTYLPAGATRWEDVKPMVDFQFPPKDKP